MTPGERRTQGCGSAVDCAAFRHAGKTMQTEHPHRAIPGSTHGCPVGWRLGSVLPVDPADNDDATGDATDDTDAGVAIEMAPVSI